MFRFYGGQVVKKGMYWNLSTGENITVEHGRVLPGDRQVRYMKIPTAGIFFLGPLYGLLFVSFMPLLSLFVVLTFLPRIAAASHPLKSEEAAACMSCHSTQGMVKTLTNKETLSVYVAPGHFKGTVHSFVPCTGCHVDVSLDNHPSAQYASKKEFALHVSTACRSCHTDGQIQSNAVHRNAAARAHAPPCSDCHGSHSIKKILGWKQKASTTQYCLTCHREKLSTSVNGEFRSLSINEKSLKKSMHGNHSCTDCHTEFSRKDHPLKKARSKRALSLSLTEVCRRCHSDKFTQLEGSIHHDALSKGNLNAPICTDCHGAHAVGPTAMAETLSGVPCKKCHEKTFTNYKNSVHGKAKMDGKEIAPICASCHFAHEVKPVQASRSPRTACLRCHETAADAHAEWLPNSAIHIEAVSCTVCHVPDVERSVYLRITDCDSGACISKDQMKAFLGKDYEMLTKDGGGGIEGRQLWDIYQKLNDENIKITLTGTLGLQNCNQSHGLAPKSKAVKECDKCHNADSEFFKTVAMVVVTPEGKETLYPVNRAVLGSMYSMLPLNQFYALGSTRLRILDIIGIFMLLAGMSVPLVHSAARIMTAQIREARRAQTRHKEGGR